MVARIVIFIMFFHKCLFGQSYTTTLPLDSTHVGTYVTAPNDRWKIINCLAYCKANEKKIMTFPEGQTFSIDTGIVIGDYDVEIRGNKSVIKYNTGTFDLSSVAQGGFPYGNKVFLILNSDIVIDGLDFRGDYNPITFQSSAIYNATGKTEVKNCYFLNCPAYISIAQETELDSISNYFHHNKLEKWWAVGVNTGRNSRIEFNEFVQAHEDSTIYDHVTGTNGSSHAIYSFAGQGNTEVVGNKIYNSRVDGIKFSGTSFPLNHVNITNNSIENCGTAITIGADDTNDHAFYNISGNHVIDCFGRRTNYTSGEVSIKLFGIHNVDFHHNTIEITQTPGAGFLNYLIRVQLLSLTHAPIYNIKINNNTLGTNPLSGLILPSTVGIYCENVNQAEPGEFQIVGNDINGVTLFNITNSNYAKIRDNFSSHGTSFGSFTGCAFLEFSNNTISADFDYTNNVSIILSGCTFPDLNNNKAVEFSSNKYQALDVGYNNDGDMLLNASAGLAFPTQGKQTMLFGYGNSWVVGDSILFNGTTTAKYITDFTNRSNLVSWINTNVAGTEALFLTDGTLVDSNYILVRNSTVAVNSNSYRLNIYTKYDNAGVLLVNGVNVPNNNAQIGRGGSTGNNKLLVVSPNVFYTQRPTIIANDEESSIFLAANGYWVSTEQQDNNVFYEVNFPSEIPTSTKFYFKL